MLLPTNALPPPREEQLSEMAAIVGAEMLLAFQNFVLPTISGCDWRFALRFWGQAAELNIYLAEPRRGPPKPLWFHIVCTVAEAECCMV
jgi:hypothetical protein